MIARSGSGSKWWASPFVTYDPEDGRRRVRGFEDRPAGGPFTLLDGLTNDAAVNLQVAPGEGLYLAAPVFDNYNKYKAQPPQKPKLEWDATHAKHDVIERFRVEVIEDGIVQGGKAEALLPWVLYLWQVRLFGFPLSVEDPIPVPNPTVDANGRSSFSPAAAEGWF